MAQFGAKRPRFAPVATTPEGALPTYNFEKAVTIGKLVKADLSLTNASGELYADDGLAEKIDMFASGSLALETDDKTDEVHAAIHGAALDEETSEVTDSDADVAPRGGLAYYKVIIRNGVRIFKGVFHPLVKAVQRGDKGLVYHVRDELDHVQYLSLRVRRMAQDERIYRGGRGGRLYRMVRRKAR